MRVGGTEYAHHAGQRRVCARAHVQGQRAEPDGVDADHSKHSRSHWAQVAPPAIGQCTTMVALARLTSMRMFAVGSGLTGSIAALTVSGTKVCDRVMSVPWQCSRNQRCTMAALMP